MITASVLRRISPSRRQYLFERPSFADELPLGIRVEVGKRMIDEARKDSAVDIELRKPCGHADRAECRVEMIGHACRYLRRQPAFLGDSQGICDPRHCFRIAIAKAPRYRAHERAVGFALAYVGADADERCRKRVRYAHRP